MPARWIDLRTGFTRVSRRASPDCSSCAPRARGEIAVDWRLSGSVRRSRRHHQAGARGAHDVSRVRDGLVVFLERRGTRSRAGDTAPPFASRAPDSPSAPPVEGAAARGHLGHPRRCASSTISRRGLRRLTRDHARSTRISPRPCRRTLSPCPRDSGRPFRGGGAAGLGGAAAPFLKGLSASREAGRGVLRGIRRGRRGRRRRRRPPGPWRQRRPSPHRRRRGRHPRRRRRSPPGPVAPPRPRPLRPFGGGAGGLGGQLAGQFRGARGPAWRPSSSTIFPVTPSTVRLHRPRAERDGVRGVHDDARGRRRGFWRRLRPPPPQPSAARSPRPRAPVELSPRRLCVGPPARRRARPGGASFAFLSASRRAARSSSRRRLSASRLAARCASRAFLSASCWALHRSWAAAASTARRPRLPLRFVELLLERVAGRRRG